MATLPVSTLPPFTAEGNGLLLREWRDSDLAAMCAVFDDVDVARWTPMESPFDLPAAQRHLAKTRAARLTNRALYVAVVADGQPPLGEVMAFVPPEAGDDSTDIELGYAIARAHRGQRIAVRAVDLFVQGLIDLLGIRRFRLEIAVDNTASQRAATALGARRLDLPPVARNGPRGSVTLQAWELERLP